MCLTLTRNSRMAIAAAVVVALYRHADVTKKKKNSRVLNEGRKKVENFFHIFPPSVKIHVSFICLYNEKHYFQAMSIDLRA